MRDYYRNSRWIPLVLVFIALTYAPLAQGNAQARFVHVAPGASAVDIYVNSRLAVADLSYGDASSYLQVPAGDLNIVANHAGTSSIAFGQRESVADGTATTFITASGGASQMTAVAENLTPLAFGEGRLSIVYAVADGPPVDIVLPATSQTLAEGALPGSVVGDYELSAEVFNFALMPDAEDDETPMLEFRVALSAGVSQMVIIYGNAGNPQILTAHAAASGSEGGGLVRFAHAVQGATPVDVSVNDVLIVPALSYANPTEHIALPGGSHRIGLGIGGVEISSLALNVSAGQAQTVIIMGSPANLMVSPYADDLGQVSATSATVSLINAIPDGVVNQLALSSGISTAVGVDYGESSAAARIVAGRQGLALDLTVGEESGTVSLRDAHFYGGSYYNLIALPGDAFSSPQLLIAETPVLRGTDIPAMMQMVETVTETIVETVETEVPVAVATPFEFEGPTAVVTVNTGANLQLREYPTSISRSLGLAPSGSLLYVLGRRGLTEYYGAEPADEPVDLSDFDADPAAELQRWQDLVPADTWLYVTYLTPDGGSVNAWVNALYLDVTDEDGDPQRLADLEMIRQNEWGRAAGTSIGPPQPPVRVSAQVYNLDFGVGLNVRRANDATTEILGQLEAGMLVGLAGLDESDEWAFVNYQHSDGVTLSGWASTMYLQLLLDGVPITLQELRERAPALINVVSDSLRGGIVVSGDAEAPAVPTRDPFLGRVAGTVGLDPDANLHLRRHPSASAESLALIPSGTKMVVDGITEVGDWYRVSYNDRTGWAFAAYITLSFNNRFLTTEELQNRLIRYDGDGDPIPVPEPEAAEQVSEA